MKELPKMYHSSFNKNIGNNKKVFSSINDKEDYSNVVKKEKIINNKKNYTVEQKIYNIFNSPNYIYKMDVTIITDNGKYDKRIVGKTKNNLITFDGEYIPINTIRDIYITRYLFFLHSFKVLYSQR